MKWLKPVVILKNALIWCPTEILFLSLAHQTLFFSSVQELKNLIPKSAVGTLSANSSNVINLIIDAYNVSARLTSSIYTDRNIQPVVAPWKPLHYLSKLLWKTELPECFFFFGVLTIYISCQWATFSVGVCSLFRLKLFWRTASFPKMWP